MKRLFKGLLAGLLVFSNMSLTVTAEEKRNEEFDEFYHNEFIETVESDFLTLHFTLKDYESWGVEKPDRTFGEAGYHSYAEAVEVNQEVLDKLRKFDYNSLSESQKVDYDVLEKYLENVIELNKYPMLDQLFNPYSGILDNITTNLTEYVFYRKEDIDDYLEVAKDIEVFLRDAIELTKMQSEEGIFLSDDLLEGAFDYIDKFVAKVDDNALIIVFDNRIDEFEGLSAEEKQAYKDKNKEIIQKSIIPAFQNTRAELEKLQGTGRYTGSILNYPNGKEYYEALVRMKTSTDYTIDEHLKMCEEILIEGIEEYMALLSDSGVYFEYISETVGFEDAEAVLKHLENNLQSYPKGPEITYKGSYLDPSVANDATVAYYMEPPLDDIKNNVIKINGDSIDNMNNLYETMAHEGFPGHCYQITWYLNTNPAPLRSVISTIGYTEGWAMYAESNAWSYSGLSKTISKLHGLETLLGYIMDAYADLGVNGKNWSIEELGSKLDKLGLNGDMAESLYDFVITRRGMILPYGIGLVQFMRLRGKATSALKDQFDEVEFNEVLLTNGARPFEMVEKDVDAYIVEKGGEVPTAYRYIDWYMNDDYASGTHSGGATPPPATTADSNMNAYVPKPVVYTIAAICGVLALLVIFGLVRNAKKNPLA